MSVSIAATRSPGGFFLLGTSLTFTESTSRDISAFRSSSESDVKAWNAALIPTVATAGSPRSGGFLLRMQLVDYGTRLLTIVLASPSDRRRLERLAHVSIHLHEIRS
jgi:hypothetical protein